MSGELLDRWVEQARALGLDDNFISSMKAEWQSRLLEIEGTLHPELEAEIFIQLLPTDDFSELEMRQKERMDAAIDMGMDLSKLEELNAAERRQYDKKEEQSDLGGEGI